MLNSDIKKRINEFYKKAAALRLNQKHSNAMTSVINNTSKEQLEVVKALKLKAKKIADIGGAEGDFIFWLSDSGKLSKDSSATLIDISQPYLHKAEEKYRKKYFKKFKFKTILLDLDDLNIKEEFDVVFFKNLFEHLYFPDKALQNIHNSLNEKGLLFLTTPNRNRLNEIINRSTPYFLKKKLKKRLGTDLPEIPDLEEQTGIKEHCHEYSFNELKRILEKNKFKILKVKYSTIPFIIPLLCDKYPFVLKVQKTVINILNFIKLNRFFCFEFIILAEKS